VGADAAVNRERRTAGNSEEAAGAPAEARLRVGSERWEQMAKAGFDHDSSEAGAAVRSEVGGDEAIKMNDDLEREYDEAEEDAVAIQHVGYRAERVMWPSRDLERAFAFRWLERNASDLTNLSLLLDGAEDEWRPVTQRDARVAATVIQWLGTNCGFNFLLETLRQTGYEVRDVRRGKD
jgi:hypothetical protein